MLTVFLPWLGLRQRPPDGHTIERSRHARTTPTMENQTLCGTFCPPVPAIENLPQSQRQSTCIEVVHFQQVTRRWTVASCPLRNTHIILRRANTAKSTFNNITTPCQVPACLEKYSENRNQRELICLKGKDETWSLFSINNLWIATLVARAIMALNSSLSCYRSGTGNATENRVVQKAALTMLLTNPGKLPWYSMDEYKQISRLIVNIAKSLLQNKRKWNSTYLIPMHYNACKTLLSHVFDYW